MNNKFDRSRMYTLDDHGIDRFFMVPKSLYENPKYSNIDNSAKMLYAILRDRQDLSVKNQWYDEEGCIFFYYDVVALAEYMNVSRTTITRYKNQLIKYGLLFQRRMGQGKPNRMYILKPESIENTKTTRNWTSRIPESEHLDDQKLDTNDTELKETERMFNTSFEMCKEVTVFIECFKHYFGYEHRKVLNPIDLSNLKDLSIDELPDIFYEYFDKYSNGDKIHDIEKCSINNVFASITRYIKNNSW